MRIELKNNAGNLLDINGPEHPRYMDVTDYELEVESIASDAVDGRNHGFVPYLAVSNPYRS